MRPPRPGDTAGAGSPQLNHPHDHALAFVGVSILAPTCAGVAFHACSPGLAPKLSKILGFVNLVPFVAFTIVTKRFRKEAMHSLGGPVEGAMLPFV